MSKPLTNLDRAHLKAISGSDPQLDALDAALARLDYLERKVQAADRLVDAMRPIAPLVTVAYDEVK